MENNIYHYCSFNTFFTIIKYKTIRLSDVTQSNDYDEIKWSSHIIKNVFADSVEKLFADEGCRNIANEIVQNNIDYYINNKSYSVLACCFSEKKDLLSQWRGYADDGRGFSIGYIPEQIKKLINKIPIENCRIIFGKVSYNEDEQVEIIKKEINLYLEKNDLSNIEIFDEKIHMLFDSLFEQIIYFKNPFFSEECEWRICLIYKSSEYSLAKIDNKNIDFYSRDNKIIPFIDLSFEENEAIIDDVVIGPKNKAEKVKDFLEVNSISCTVVESKGTYR